MDRKAELAMWIARVIRDEKEAQSRAQSLAAERDRLIDIAYRERVLTPREILDLLYPAC